MRASVAQTNGTETRTLRSRKSARAMEQKEDTPKKSANRPGVVQLENETHCTVVVVEVADVLRRPLKCENNGTPPLPALTAYGNSEEQNSASKDAESSGSETAGSCETPSRADEYNQADRKDEIQRLISGIGQQEMPQLDNESQDATCAQDLDVEASPTTTSSDDKPPQLIAAKCPSNSPDTLDEESSRDDLGDNTSPPPLESMFSGITSEAGPSVSKKSCSETDWAKRMTEMLGELHPSQFMQAKETIYSTTVKVLAQEITSDVSCLLNLIESQERRAAAFERILSDLRKLKSDHAPDSNL
ncbi:unnamed protein product [Gongylonema pulchrum]|uniref:Uncharacterized protein n=1 Tax=Gongylonema pulchrum TaxID=637853 RepID=A0A183DTA6_9BILA|nr:unnamed protein product [Gongylonema pulchrum]